MNEVSANKPRTRRLIRWLIFGVVGLPFLVIGGCYAMCSGFVLFDGGFTPKQVYSLSAPDGRSTVVVTKRVAFPATEFFDPAIVVTVELREALTDRVVASEQLALEEDSDLREPTVEWTQDAIRIRDIDSRHERNITILRNAQQ